MLKTFQYDEVPVLETTSGKLKGYFYNGSYVFKGVPYAYADRFQMPVLPTGKESGTPALMVLYVH